uniref:GAF domain-containing protein n=1 Tax=candidate division WOR-3 bacterium TaxID=2052148 RepID=A0A7C4U7K8_UNCW3
MEKIGEREINLLIELGSYFATTRQPEKMLDYLLESIEKLMDAEASSILLVDEKRRKLVFASARGEAAEKLKGLTVPIGEGIAGIVAKEGIPRIVNDTAKEPKFYKKIDDATGFKTKSILCVPLKTPDKIIGVIEILNRRSGIPYDNDDLKLLERFAPIATRIIVDTEKMLRILEREEVLRSEIDSRYTLIAKSKKMKDVIELADVVAPTDTTVLLIGESGTGKELIARYIHRKSKRKDEPFIPVNCAAFPTTLLEAELFGHTKGAYTGAIYERKGRFEIANLGTIFLDEISEIGTDIQVKLLRVLQEKIIEKLGSSEQIKVDVRIITATSQSLEKKIEEGKFREDFYFRINVFPITIPPLRERKEDIPVLAEYFLTLFSREIKKPVRYISKDVIELFLKYDWPGNVRELQNVIERAVVLAKGDTLKEEDIVLGKKIRDFPHISSRNLTDALKEFKKYFILKTLEENDWNQRKVSRLLGIQPTYLSRLIKELGITRHK